MLRHLFIGMAALGCFQMPAQALPGPPGPPHGKWDPARLEKMHAERLEHRHKMLHLTAAQEPAWQAYTSKMAAAKPSAPPRRPEGGHQEMTSPERMEKMLAHFKEMESHLQAHLAATKEFYAVLSPEQKTIFDLTEHHGPPGGPHRRGGGGRGHGPPMSDDDSDEEMPTALDE